MLHPTPVEKLNVVILYERLAYVARAMAAYAHLARELAADFTPDFRVWRLDIAQAPGFADEAERDIAAAGVIIMAVDGHKPCPPAFHRWKGGAGAEGGGLPRAVIAFTETNDGSGPGIVPPAESWIEILRSSATQISDEVFVCDPPPALLVGPRAEAEPSGIPARPTARA